MISGDEINLHIKMLGGQSHSTLLRAPCRPANNP